MNPKSSAHYQREFRKRLRDQGLVKKEVWIRPENTKQLAALEKQLRKTGTLAWARGENNMSKIGGQWTTTSLFHALKETELFRQEQAYVELIDGIEPALHIVMHEYGDLPIFLTVSGEQIIVEAILWSIDTVKDINQFNEAVLRTHKYFPLSTISLDVIGDGADYYHMFGALSSTSILSNVLFEIEVLAANVIQATEAYSEFLKIDLDVMEG